MKYLKKFDTDEQYEEYINSDDAAFPNVSLCTGNNYSKVYFNSNGKAVFTYNVLNAGETTKLFNIPDDPNQPLGIKSMEVDGVVIEPVEFSHNNYIFSEKGYHSVKYTFYDNEISGARFFNCSDLIFIDVPNNIRAVDSYAFDGTAWYNNQPDGFVYVGNVLYGYKGTVPTEITIREGTLGIGGRAFYNCTNLISINIPNSVTSIGSYAFYGCTNLISINIPNSVTSIGSNAFYNCSGLTSIEIPNSVTYIGYYAFYNCDGLTSIEIPESVTFIGYYAFYGCSKLSSILVNNPLSLSSKLSQAVFNETAWYNNQPDGVVYLSDYVYSYKGVVPQNTSLVFRENTVGILCQAFYSGKGSDRSGLISVTIPEGTKFISYGAFQFCTGLASIEIPNSVTEIGEYAFYQCYALTSINIPIGITSIKDGCFRECRSLVSINIPNSVTEIGNVAFYGCTNLTSIEIPDSVTSIGSSAFNGCSSLTTMNIPNSVTSISGRTFYGCSSLTSIEIPNSVTEIGNDAFYGCSSLTRSIKVDSNNSNYDSRDDCNAIIETATNKLIVGCSNTIIPESVISIGDYAFYNCTNLISINIPESVTSIGERAFYYCTNLTSIEILNSVTLIGSGVFNGCSSLTSIEIPNSVTSIGTDAFRECSSLTSIKIPNSVISIGNNVFNGCTSLTSINIPNSVTSIGSSVFNSCTSLTSINIPNGVTSIGNSTFYRCSSLTSINIPTSVTEIGVWAFYNCSSLVSVTVLATTPPTLGQGAFNNNASGRKIYVPAGSVNTYKVASGWSNYADYIEAIPSEINLLNDADNSTTLNTWNGVTLDVKLKDRTLYKDGYWNTICLPFSLSSLISTPLEGAIVKKLNYSQYDAEQSELCIDFEDVNNIDAGTPYLIKWTPASDYVDDDAHNLVEPIFSGVTINNTLSPIETEYVDCIGIMSPVILEANDVTKFYIGGDNTPYFPGENITINSLRIYFQLKKGLTAGDMSINPNA